MIWTSRWRSPIVILFAIALVTIGVLIGGGWSVSNRIKDGVLEPKHGIRPFDLEVSDLGEGRIKLRVTPHTIKDDRRTDGIWGLRWNKGYAQVGEILDSNNQQVVRRFVPLSGKLKRLDKVRLDALAFPDDPEKAFGLRTQEVRFSSQLGDFKGWLIRGHRSTWVIFVHGKRDHPPRKPLRAYPILPTVANLGLPSLIISYRNDLGAPKSPDGFHRYGQTEWQDLEGAAKYAIKHGAEEIVLVGYSMGGGIVMNFLYKSPLAEKVKGVILDSPMLDLSATIDLGARLLGFPIVLPDIGKFIAGIRFGIDWEARNYLSRANDLNMPILLFHSDADTTVPVETSEALARARPDIVEYHRVPGATHIRSWNMNPIAYETAVHKFLRDLIQE